jgi:L-alanine-DL-glutamate epimerase-like enolase superfamily enzyme
MTAAPITRVTASAYTIPTDAPEADGTIEWDATGLVIAEVEAGGVIGMGYSYADPSAHSLIMTVLAAALRGVDAMDIPSAWIAMTTAVRNVGRPGVASCAISALDVALWDLKAKLIGLPLATVLGAARRDVAAYGSGGFTSYTNQRLATQLGGWAADGLSAVKMKIGRAGRGDVERVRVAREAIGPDVELFVDANGAYKASEAIAYAERFARFDVSWFEEPVSSDDLAGLRFVRHRAPPGMRVAAGEYGFEPSYVERMLGAAAVDVLQVDGTRCGGVSGFVRASTLCEVHNAPLSAHTAPSLHATLCCVAPPALNVEYFHDHARIEHMLFDGARTPECGRLAPDWDRPGLGLELKRADAARYAA